MYRNLLAVIILVINAAPCPSLAKPTSYERKTKPVVHWTPYVSTNPLVNTTTTPSTTTTKRFKNPNFNKTKDYNETKFDENVNDITLNPNLNLLNMSDLYSDCVKKIFKRMVDKNYNISCTLTPTTPTTSPTNQHEQTIIKYFAVKENRIDYQLILLGVIALLLAAIVFVLLYTKQIKQSERIIYMDKLDKLEKPIDNLGYLRV